MSSPVIRPKPCHAASPTTTRRGRFDAGTALSFDSIVGAVDNNGEFNMTIYQDDTPGLAR